MNEKPKDQNESGNWVQMPKDMTFEEYMAWRAEQKKKRKAAQTKSDK